jgi:hypothetical protein
MDCLLFGEFVLTTFLIDETNLVARALVYGRLALSDL